VGVTEIVRPNARQPGRLERTEQRASDLVGCEIVTRFRSEYEFACLPNLANLQSHLVLSRFICAQNVRQIRVGDYYQ